MEKAGEIVLLGLMLSNIFLMDLKWWKYMGWKWKIGSEIEAGLETKGTMDVENILTNTEYIEGVELQKDHYTIDWLSQPDSQKIIAIG